MLSIIPKPNGAVTEGAAFVIMPTCFGVALNGFAPWVLEAFCLRTGRTAVPGDDPWLMLRQDPTLPVEGYRLCVEETGVTIFASGETGALWGLTTLTQLYTGSGKIPTCDIQDAPKYPHRGLNFDCVRHFFSVETVKQVIEQISLVKMNVLHWHLTDDQAWRVETLAYPQLHQTSSEYYTREQIQEIVRYAQLRGVEIIPEIDLPGHATGILSVFPEYSCSGKPVDLVTCGGIFSFVLCAGKEETYRFLERLMDDICPLFPSKLFHIGGDEAPKTNWETCPDCRRKMKEQNLATTDDLQGYFTKRLSDILARHGKQIICWNDALKASKLPEDMQIQYWTIQHLKPMQAYLAKGKPFIYSDMYDMYLDYPHSMISLKKLYNSRLMIGSRSCADAPGLRGMEVCCWTERIPDSTQLFRRLFPRIMALAEAAWTQKKDYPGFRQQLRSYVRRLDRENIAYTAEQWWDPTGKARLNESIHYVQSMFPDAYQDTQEQTADIQKINATFLKALLNGFFPWWNRPKVAKALTGRRGHMSR